MTRNIQVGLSHGEKAKKLSYSGFYEEALKELNVALKAFEAENREGQWDDAVASVLNNAGFVYLFIGDYQRSEDTFRSALAIKEHLGNKSSIAGTLAGLADAYRGQCKFAEAMVTLEEALYEAMAAKDENTMRTLMASMDTLERIRCDMPDASCGKVDFDELYVPASGSEASAKVTSLKIVAQGGDTVGIEADIGFPYLMRDLDGIGSSGSRLFPAMALIFPKGTESSLKRLSVTDEEENAVVSSAFPHDGILFGPGSYHLMGPVPMPACKQFVFTYGAGHVLGWPVCANGYYHVEASVGVKGMSNGTQLLLAMPFGTVKLRSVAVMLEEPDTWSRLRLACGTFTMGRRLDTALPAYSENQVIYEGPAKDMIKSGAGASLKYGILCLDLIK
jgi:tetratricopeptide (TPR) repeat protein